jgi:hypothetical protein
MHHRLIIAAHAPAVTVSIILWHNLEHTLTVERMYCIRAQRQARLRDAEAAADAARTAAAQDAKSAADSASRLEADLQV